MLRNPIVFLVVVTSILSLAPPSEAADVRPDTSLFARDNLVAWCIVPYDARHRSPEDRAAMLDRVGIRHFSYDWRKEHLPTFERELDALAAHHVELTAVWFPTSLNADAQFILDVLKRHNTHTQLWVSSAGTPLGKDAEVERNVAAAAGAMKSIADEAAKIGCTVALYNHGGWLGEPENMVAVVEKLNRPDVGIVYNLHHGHDHVNRFKAALERMKPRLLCITLNGMTANGERIGRGILPIGQGELDLGLLRTIRDSGYRGRLAILNESSEDAEGRLLDNIEGLDWLVPQLDGKPAGPRPLLRTYRPAKAEATARPDYWAVEDAQAREALPLFQTLPAANAGDLTPANGWPDAAQYADWFRSHGNDANTRFSRLDQITRDNVKTLKPAWVYHSNDGKGNIQCNPIIVDGIVYAPTVGNAVVAIDGANGHELWRFTPTGRPAHRGLTYFKGDGRMSARLLFASGTHLWALEPKTGKPITSFGDAGGAPIVDCVVAPAVYRDVIVYAGWNRDVFGIDLASGAPRWTFHTVPREGEPGAETWDRRQQGANCWGGMALDASRGIAYVTTGSPKPNFVGVGHHGDNLFGNCVIALDAITGERLWHFQEIRHDIWDLDIPAPPILVTVTHAGRRVDAVAAVTKIGNTLLLDRVSGKPLFPFRLRRAPTSLLRGEMTAPYQPDVELPQPFARRAFTLDDVTDLSPAAHDAVMAKLANASFGWFTPFEEGKPLAMYGFHGGAEWTGACFDPASGLLFVSSNEIPWTPGVFRSERPDVDETKLPATPGRLVYQQNCMPCHGPSREGLMTAPSLLGVSHRLKDGDVLALLKTGRGTMPAAPQLDEAQKKVLLDYLFDRDRPDAKPTERAERPSYRDGGYPKLLDKEGYPGCKPPWGKLSAIDLNTGKIAWSVPLGEYDELTKRGVPKTGTENFGGPIVTAGGLIFCAGTRDGNVRAFDKQTGAELWSHALPFVGTAPPSVYAIAGKQYLIVPATGGGKLDAPMGDTYAAFALP